MNSCGLDHLHIVSEFVNIDEISEIIKQYYFSEWYPKIYGKIFTPESFIFPHDVLLNPKDMTINSFMREKFRYCFARLDTCSSKPTKPFYNIEEIYDHLINSDRTRYFMEDIDMKLIIREWMWNITCEFRCYVYDKKLRAISTTSQINKKDDKKKIEENFGEINRIIEIIIKECYDDCTVDLCFSDEKLMLIEINTPVYLCATSGNFDLTIPADFEILLGESENLPVIIR